MPLDLFSPLATTSVAVSTSTASGALTVPTAPMTSSARVYNSTTGIVFVKFGTSSVTAATTDMPVPPGGVETYELNPNITHVAGIMAAGSGTLYVTTGRGA